jgi:hypothetical protein
VSVTVVPDDATVGEKLVITGAPSVAVTVKLPLLVADPPGAVTPIGPVVAPAGTVATIEVEVDEATTPDAPLKLTVLLPGVALNPVP